MNAGDKIALGQPRKNFIINGNFDIWQRGTSASAVASRRYVADRWVNDSSLSTNAPSQQAFTTGQTSVPGEPKYFLRTVIASAANTVEWAMVSQLVESVRTLAGKTATLSFWAKADAAKPMVVEFTQNFGSGGAPSAAVLAIGVTSVALTTNWQKFTVTVAIPSINGKDIGTNGDDFLGINFWFDAGTTTASRTNSLGQQSGTFDIAQVQLEEGSVATNFEYRHIALELAMCQRYYQRFGEGVSGCVQTTAAMYFTHEFPHEMRTAPSFSAVTTSFTVTEMTSGGAQTRSLSSLAVYGGSSTTKGCQLSSSFTAVPAMVAGNTLLIGDATTVFQLDAEL